MNPYLERLLFSCLLGASAAAAANAAELPAPRMAERSAACVACHGQQGQASSDGLFPRIAGKPQAYLYQQLLSFRDGRRVHAQMSYLLAPLSDAYLNDMASWFADQHVPYPAPAPVKVTPQVLAHGRQLVMQGDPSHQIPACVACHGQQLSGVLPGTPGLLGLPRDYLNLQFGAWRTGVRRAAAPDCMAQVASRLTPDEVTAVAAWLASQPVPAAYAPASAHLAPLPLECGSAK